MSGIWRLRWVFDRGHWMIGWVGLGVVGVHDGRIYAPLSLRYRRHRGHRWAFQIGPFYFSANSWRRQRGDTP